MSARLSVSVRRWAWILLSTLVVYTVIGFFLLPPILRGQLEKRLTAALGRTVTVEKVRLNPYALSITIEHLDVRTPDGKASFAGWDRLYVNAGLLPSLSSAWVVENVELAGAHGAVAIEKDGSFDFSDILNRLEAATPNASETPGTAEKPSRPIRVRRLVVSNATLHFEDRSREKPFATTVGPVSFQLADFVTSGSRNAPYRFEASTEAGEKLAWNGTLAVAPFRSTGELSLEGIALAKYGPYYAPFLRAEITDGKLSLRGKYAIDLSPAARVLRLSEGAVHLRTLKLLEAPQGPTVLEIPSLDVDGISADAVTFAAEIVSIRTEGGRAALRRNADGALNVLALLPAPSAATAPPASPGSSRTAPTTAAPASGTGTTSAVTPTPSVRVNELAVRNYALDVVDLAGPRPVHLALSQFELGAKSLSLAPNAEIPFHVAFAWAPEGRFAADGSAVVLPEPRAKLKLEVSQFALLPLSPYLEAQVDARLTQGALTTAQEIQFSLHEGQPTIDLTGRIQVDNFGLVDGTHSEELAGFRSLALNGLHVTTAPKLALHVDEIALAAPYARVVVREDKSLNVAALVRSSPPAAGAAASVAATPPPAQPATTAAPEIEIGKITIAEGDFSATDRSVSPNVRVGVRDFGGTIGELSSSRPARAAVDLHGAFDGVGPITISGRLDPLGQPQFVELKTSIRNLDLLAFSPYSGKYAGFEIARGKLGLDASVRLEGQKLEAQNVLTMSQFTFGSPVASPDATKLPVRLGVALLKDLNGQIVIDIPVAGDLGDPSFRVGKVVLRVVVNLLSKAAVSPFSLLGSMFGGGGDELAFQEFEPGLAELRASERPKLETMVKALANRPGLSLSLEGTYDGPADAFALKRQKLTNAIRTQIWETRRATDPNLPPPEKLEITSEQFAAQIKTQFDAKFPPGTQFGAPLPAAPPVSTTPPPPPTGFFKRAVRVLTLASFRESRAVQKENEQRKAEHEKAVAAADASGRPVDEMIARLAETITVNDDDLRSLGESRARAVREYFLAQGKIAPDRLFLEKTAAAAENRGPRVFLHLQ